MKERAGEFSGPEGRRAVYNHAEPKDKRCCGCVGTERETVRRMDTQREGKWERLFFFWNEAQRTCCCCCCLDTTAGGKKKSRTLSFSRRLKTSVFSSFFLFFFIFFKFYLASISCVFLIVFIMIIFFVLLMLGYDGEKKWFREWNRNDHFVYFWGAGCCYRTASRAVRFTWLLLRTVVCYPATSRCISKTQIGEELVPWNR